MKILSIIGTRPQYIKIKSIYDYCRQNKISHKIIDTNQHYSNNVSRDLVDDLGLKIDFNLDTDHSDEVDFICKVTSALSGIIRKESPDVVFIYGDTNSTFCGALAAYKIGIPVAHIEAGERCFDNSVPEEINRIYSDSIATINFCSSRVAQRNINGIFCGDLEYDTLNKINPNISFEDFGIMTIHRQSNCSAERVKDIFNFCSKVNKKIKFFAHHRIKKYIPETVPVNISILESCRYTAMCENLSKCSFIITDSGSIQKISPFFGKNALIMRDSCEWTETVDKGYSRLRSEDAGDIEWLLSNLAERDRNFYSNGKRFASEIIIKKILHL